MNRHMLLFLSLYLVLYGLMHLYFYSGFRHLAGSSVGWRIAYGVFSVFMVLSPILARWCEAAGSECLELYLAWIAYLWMGFLFISLSLMVFFDLLKVIISFTGSPFSGRLLQWFTPSVRFITILMVSLVLCIYGYFTAWSIGMDHIILPTSQIPRSIGSLRLVQISDIHLGLMVKKKKADIILQKVREWDPHILVCTGDLVDGQMGSMDGVSELFAALHSPGGKFAVTGNHEFYVGIEQAEQFIRKAGFTLLRGETVVLEDVLAISGVDDPAAGLFHERGGLKEEELLERVPGEVFHILLKHQPEVEEASRGLFDLQLSGHIHGGQIFPFTLLTRLAYSYGVGLHDAGKGSLIYVSPGAGTWGPPMRILANPRITVIDLVNPQISGHEDPEPPPGQ